VENSPSEEDIENRKRRVLEIGRHNLHRAHLDTPSDAGAMRRRLETHRLPVGGLVVLELEDTGVVVLMQHFREDAAGRMTDEEVSDVFC
jgi:hypothetical protein